MFFHPAPPTGKSFLLYNWQNCKNIRIIQNFCSTGESCVVPPQCPCEWEGSVFPPGTTITQHCQNWLVNLKIGYFTFFYYNPNWTQKGLTVFFPLCVVPVRMVCGSVRAWLALLPPLPVWKQSLPVLGGAASPPSGCVTTRMTVAMVRMRSAHPPALQTNSAVSTCQGESKLSKHYFCVD